MRRWSHVLRMALVISVLVAAPVSPVRATPSTAQIEGVTIGFQGHFKRGHFAPVRVKASAGRASQEALSVAVMLLDSDGVQARFRSAPVPKRPSESRVVELDVYVKIGPTDRPATVELYEGGTLVDQATIDWKSLSPLAATDELVVTIGAAAGADEALRVTAGQIDRAARAVALPDAAALPDESIGLDAIDALLLVTSDQKILRSLANSPRAVEALRTWVELGGTLVVCGSANAARVWQGEGPLAGLLPARFVEMIPLAGTTALESYAETNHPLAMADERRLVPRLEATQGVVELWGGNREGELPLVIRAAHGFGEVVLAAVDLDQSPLAEWPGRAAFVNRLLARSTQQFAQQEPVRRGAVTTIGYADMSGQLRAALDAVPGIRFIPFWIVALLAGGYLAWIGPGDYGLVQRLWRRPGATWITFPLVGLVLAGGATLAALHTKGSQVRLRQVDLLDFDLTDSRGDGTAGVRGSAWWNLFSPAATAYDLALRPQLPSAPGDVAALRTLLSWQGLPGVALGGLEATGAGRVGWPAPYEFSSGLDRLHGFPVRTWSSRSLHGQWYARVPAPLTFDLREGADRLVEGEIRNQQAGELTDAALYFDRWVVPIGNLSPGAALAIGPHTPALDARTLSTRRKLIGDADVTEVYDPESTDLARILEVQMFHEMIGGDSYTRLGNRYQRFVDLSPLLCAGRAVLVARVSQPSSRLQIEPNGSVDDSQPATAVVRFVLPVQARGGSAAPQP